MNRPAVIYIAMLIVLIAGLWAVLEVGAKLSASEDLAGKWELHPSSTGSADKGLTIEQSGEFFQLAFDQGPHLDLKLTKTSDANLLLSNSHSQLQVTGKEGSDDKTFILTGDHPGQWSGQWIAHRTVRTFPADVSAAEGK